jgi:hypothetical protein
MWNELDYLKWTIDHGVHLNKEFQSLFSKRSKYGSFVLIAMIQIINMLVIVEDIFMILACLGICVCKKITNYHVTTYYFEIYGFNLNKTRQNKMMNICTRHKLPKRAFNY